MIRGKKDPEIVCKEIVCKTCGCFVAKDRAQRVVEAYQASGLDEPENNDYSFYCLTDKKNYDRRILLNLFYRGEVPKYRYEKFIPEHFEQVNKDGTPYKEPRKKKVMG